MPTPSMIYVYTCIYMYTCALQMDGQIAATAESAAGNSHRHHHPRHWVPRLRRGLHVPRLDPGVSGVCVFTNRRFRAIWNGSSKSGDRFHGSHQSATSRNKSGETKRIRDTRQAGRKWNFLWRWLTEVPWRFQLPKTTSLVGLCI